MLVVVVVLLLRTEDVLLMRGARLQDMRCARNVMLMRTLSESWHA